MSIWYEQAVFYHMYPLGLTGAPKSNAPAGEAAPAPAAGFSELERWIPHMKALNCSALYIGPLFESSSHGYDTRDYRLIDRRLGSNDDFKRFVRLCHEAGIRVVVDGVFNHTGREFFAFRDMIGQGEASAFRDWYRGVHFGWGSPMGDPFGYEAWQGHGELPCLNLQNPAVRNYLFETVRFWIDAFDIDGIRLDCANVLDFGFMEELRARTGEMKPDFWLMGEVIHGEYSRWVNPGMLHSVTNYELHKALYSGHNDHNYFEIAHNVRRLEAIGRSLYLFADNHDEDRIASKLSDTAHLKPLYQLLFTLPGIPSVYYGSEWGIEGRRSRTSDDALRPAIRIADMPADMPAAISGSDPGAASGGAGAPATGPGRAAAAPAANSGGADTVPARELSSYISALAGLRRENPELQAGPYQELLLTNRQYAFCRRGPDGIVLSAVNNDGGDCPVTIPVPIPAKSARNLLDNSETPVEGGKLSLTLPANGGLIVKILEG